MEITQNQGLWNRELKSTNLKILNNENKNHPLVKNWNQNQVPYLEKWKTKTKPKLIPRKMLRTETEGSLGNQPTLIGTSPHLVSLLWMPDFSHLVLGGSGCSSCDLCESILINHQVGLWWGLWIGHFPSALLPRSFLQSCPSLCPYPGHLAQSLLIPPSISCGAIVIPFWYFNFMFVDLLPMCIGLSPFIFSPCVLFYLHWFSPHVHWLLLLVVGFFPFKVCTIVIRCSNPMQGSCSRKSLKLRVCTKPKKPFSESNQRF